MTGASSALPHAHQPVQTMYEGAHRYEHDAVERIRDAALGALERHGADAPTLAAALGIEDTAIVERVHGRLRARLESRPLDDYRLDFEDGYGVRADEVEDAEATRAARAIARSARERTLPPRIGLRVKPLGGGTGPRALRTVDVFVSALVEAHGGLPDGFAVTLPKVAAPAEAGLFADHLDGLEAKLGLDAGALRFEFMVELPQLVLDANGRCPLRQVVQAGRGRVLAAHFGTYDYTAACGIAAAHQTMHHPACEFARQMMRVALADTGIWLSDGSTNVLPVEPHPEADGTIDDTLQMIANHEAVHAAWRRHYEDVTGSLVRGFYQGWDLHPAQLVTRYAALYVFFLGSFEPAAERLRVMLAPQHESSAARVLDDPATGEALLGFVRRAVRCGAIDEADALRRCGLTSGELDAGSFSALLAAR